MLDGLIFEKPKNMLLQVIECHISKPCGVRHRLRYQFVKIDFFNFKIACVQRLVDGVRRGREKVQLQNRYERMSLATFSEALKNKRHRFKSETFKVP